MKFYLRRDPVQEIAAHPDTPSHHVAAHPDTLALLVAARPKNEPRPQGGPGLLAVLLDLPLVPDPALPAGWIHLRPFPRRPEAASAD